MLNEQAGCCCGVPYTVTRSSLLRPGLALSLDKGPASEVCGQDRQGPSIHSSLRGLSLSRVPEWWGHKKRALF